MPVVDETPITRELKAFKAEILAIVAAIEKRVEAVEKKK